MAPPRRIYPLLAVLAFVASACVSLVEEEAETEVTALHLEPTTTIAKATPENASTTVVEAAPFVAEPGALIWIHDREPPDLHLHDPNNGTEIASWVREGLIEGLYGVDQNLAYYPELLAADATVERRDDASVVIEYQLRPGLKWSDGTPLTSADVAYTHQIITEGCETESDGSLVDATTEGCVYEMFNRSGYDLVTSFEVVDDTKFRVSFSSFFTRWRDLYDQVYAAHAFGADADLVNDSLRGWQNDQGALPSSGPLVFAGWAPGDRMEFVPNTAYHGSVSPDAVNKGPASVNKVVLSFRVGLEDRIELMANGTAHILMADLDPDLLPLTQSGVVTVSAFPGPVFEHWGMNLLDTHLKKPEVRQAIAYAIDKSAVISQIYEPLIGPVLAPNGLGNVYWMANHAAYQDNQATYAGADIPAAQAALTAAGYVRGGDGIYSHPEDGRLSLRVGTTGGNRLREAHVEVMKAQLAAAGIEVVVENAAGGLFFEQGPFNPEALEASASSGRRGNSDLWDIAQFSWSSGPTPSSLSGVFRSGSGSNPYGFANPEFDVAATDCDTISDDAERTQCYNELDKFVTTLDQGDDGLFIIPISQKPHYYAWSNTLASAAVATSSPRGGPLVNVADFQLGEAAESSEDPPTEPAE